MIVLTYTIYHITSQVHPDASVQIKFFVLFSVQFYLKPFLIRRRTKRDIFLYLHWISCKVPLVLQYFNQTGIYSRQNFEKLSNIKFNEYLSSGSWVVPCVQTDRQTDMMKTIVALRNFANAPKTNTSSNKTNK